MIQIAHVDTRSPIPAATSGNPEFTSGFTSGFTSYRHQPRRFKWGPNEAEELAHVLEA